LTLTISALVATYGDDSWSDLAWSRAYPSVKSQGFDEVVVEHHPEATLAEARNRVLASADCDYVVYCDADDELEPGYVDALRAAFHYRNLWRSGDVRMNPTLFAPAVRYVRDGGSSEATAAIPNAGRWPELNTAVIGTAVPRRLLLEVGGFEDWRAYEDYAVWLKCVATGARLVHIEDAVYRAHVSPNGRNLVRDGKALRDEIVAAHREWAWREGFKVLL
jgi:glycosyltransferase involved in cell wall biosynthesis